jgi:hypothetical protein
MAGKSGNRFFTEAICQPYAGDHVFLIFLPWPARGVGLARARADRKRAFAFTRR